MRFSRREIRRGRGSSENHSASVRKHQRCQVKREDEGEGVKQTDTQLTERADPNEQKLQKEREKQAETQLKERKIEQNVQRPLRQVAARRHEQRWTGGEVADDLQRKSVLRDQ